MKRSPSSDSLKKTKSPSPPPPKGKSESPSHKMRLLPSDFRAGPHDVICGRGKKCYNHEGNERFRLRVERLIGEYARARSKIDKSGVLSIVVEQVRRASPNGGFVKQDSDGRWYEVGDFLAREKTSQAFRDALHHYYKSSNVSKKRRREAEGQALFADQLIKPTMMPSAMTHGSFESSYGSQPMPSTARSPSSVSTGHQMMHIDSSRNSFITNPAYQQQGANPGAPAQNQHGGNRYASDFYYSSTSAGPLSGTLNSTDGDANNYPYNHPPFPHNVPSGLSPPRMGTSDVSLQNREFYAQKPQTAGLLLQQHPLHLSSGPSSDVAYGRGGHHEFYGAGTAIHPPRAADFVALGRRGNVLGPSRGSVDLSDGHFTQRAAHTTMDTEMGEERGRKLNHPYPLSRSDSFSFPGSNAGHGRDDFSVNEQEMHHSLPAIPNFEVQGTFHDRSLPAIHLGREVESTDISPFGVKRTKDHVDTEMVLDKSDEPRSMRNVELDLEPLPLTNNNASLDRFAFISEAERRKTYSSSPSAKKAEDLSTNSESQSASAATLVGQSSHMALSMRERPASVPPVSPRKQSLRFGNDSLISCFDMSLTGHSIFSSDSNPFEPFPLQVSDTPSNVERHEGSVSNAENQRRGFQPIIKNETDEQDDSSSFAEG